MNIGFLYSNTGVLYCDDTNRFEDCTGQRRAGDPRAARQGDALRLRDREAHRGRHRGRSAVQTRVALPHALRTRETRLGEGPVGSQSRGARPALLQPDSEGTEEARAAAPGVAILFPGARPPGGGDACLTGSCWYTSG